MAANFSAEQFQRVFEAPRLGNWQVPKWHPSRPLQRTKPTRIISNDSGHLLPGVTRPSSNPWGHFQSTWHLPDKISKQQAFEISAPQPRESRWAKPSQHRKTTTNEQLDAEPSEPNKKEYTPGDLTSPEERHSSRKLLDDQRRHKETGRVKHPELNELYLQKHDCKYYQGCPEPIDTRQPESPHILGDQGAHLPLLNESAGCPRADEEMAREITEKPGERNTSPLIPAYCNFQVARKMHVENLEHQPLPDSIMDRAFRRMQAQGAINPELALNVVPTATGVGVKTYMAGPTHCTKLKVFRPKTCGVVPKPLDPERYANRPQTCYGEKVKLGAMDLAIQWDHRPLDPRDEPKRAAHIDGSDASAGPAVFTVVKTPRTPNNDLQTDRSGGVFYSTQGEHSFFDKDIMRQKLPFACKSAPTARSCRCDNHAQQADRYNRENMHPSDYRQHQSRPRSVPRSRNGDDPNRRCKSSPNLSVVANPSHSQPDQERMYAKRHSHHTDGGHDQKGHARCKHKPRKTEPKKTIRLCDQLQPIVDDQKKVQSFDMLYKQPFKAGIPNSNSSGTCTSFDSGCSSMTSSNTSHSSKTSIKVPKPRHPYAKRDYIIDTLSPPFACCRGGAGQGGYPEHWRLASVYQHAYKPIEQRRRPLLATVYQ